MVYLYIVATVLVPAAGVWLYRVWRFDRALRNGSDPHECDEFLSGEGGLFAGEFLAGCCAMGAGIGVGTHVGLFFLALIGGLAAHLVGIDALDALPTLLEWLAFAAIGLVIVVPVVYAYYRLQDRRFRRRCPDDARGSSRARDETKHNR